MPETQQIDPYLGKHEISPVSHSTVELHVPHIYALCLAGGIDNILAEMY